MNASTLRGSFGVGSPLSWFREVLLFSELATSCSCRSRRRAFWFRASKSPSGSPVQQLSLSPTPAAVGGTLVEQRWSSSCRICSWAAHDQPPYGLSTRSGLWIDILISLSAARHPHGTLGLPKVERRGTMKRTGGANIQLHINVGSDFQAELPELQIGLPSEDEEPATLVWKPWGEDDSDMEKTDRVRELLDMASSHGISGAAANLELALHCLHQARGSIPEALEMLLSGGPPTPQGHPLADYHYADSDTWTPEEKESFQKAFHTSGKDFHLIQKQIQSKTVAQCVEYYYSWKKEHKLASALAQTVGEAKRNNSPPRKENGETGKRSRKRARSAECPCCQPHQPPHSAGGPFPCRQCKRVFETMKERNKHRRRHCPRKEAEPLPKKKRPN
ncbi:zinc finger protein 541-like [Vidua macroura]|uniref:zinc finger protein 541-like n=1 Tax=Vidua macroura TaxID=187451 RepID=UPI0023A79217|nr:zinc finger protein 541-like [Vidua macroura]